jgi:hypothetical protein
MTYGMPQRAGVSTCGRRHARSGRSACDDAESNAGKLIPSVGGEGNERLLEPVPEHLPLILGKPTDDNSERASYVDDPSLVICEVAEGKPHRDLLSTHRGETGSIEEHLGPLLARQAEDHWRGVRASASCTRLRSQPGAIACQTSWLVRR